MRGWQRRWIMRAANEIQDGSNDGTDAVRVGDLVQRILDARRVSATDSFLDTGLKRLRDPAELPGAEDVAARLLDAMRRDRPIVVYGDYDVDGITATAILVHVLRHLEPRTRVRSVVPHRIDDGYGLNPRSLEEIAADGATTVVTVDCGVSALAEAELAQRLGIELLVTDHHQPVRADDGAIRWPTAAAIAHPVGSGVGRPELDALDADPLCGAGVAFKVAWALLRRARGVERLPETDRRLLLDLLGFAALGTVADLVPLVGDNRVIAANGLRLVGGIASPGLRALVRACGLEPGDSVTSEQVGFRLGPHLNAVGRLGHASDAVQLLCDADVGEAALIAEKLARLNDERRSMCDVIAKDAAERAQATGQLDPGHRVILLADPAWHRGVVGICCSRLVDRFGRPTLLLQVDEATGIATGSARSVNGFSIHGALRESSDLLEGFGGHEMAAGLSVRADRIDELRDRLASIAHDHLSESDLVPGVEIDCVASLADLERAQVGRLERLEPYGSGNPRPRILLQGVRAKAPGRMGKQANHLSFNVVDAASRGGPCRAVWWKQGELAERLLPLADRSVPLDLVVEPKLNTWRGRTSVEVEVIDARESEPA